MKRVTGDLLNLAEEGRFDVIVHGCNCQNIMGAGIAKAIAEKFPEAVSADRNTRKGDRSKLGTITIAPIQRGAISFSLVNAYTQFDIRGPQPRVSYDAVASCFQRIAANFSGKHIAYPMIGAGLAGGNWSEVEHLIDQALMGFEHTLVTLPA